MNLKTAPEKITERKLSSNFWMALSIKQFFDSTSKNTTHSASVASPPSSSSRCSRSNFLPTIEDLYCCGYRYKTNLQLVLFRAIPRFSSSYYSLTPFKFSLKGTMNVSEHPDAAVRPDKGSIGSDANNSNSVQKGIEDSADLEVVLCQINVAAATSRLVNRALSHNLHISLSNIVEGNEFHDEKKTLGRLRLSFVALTGWCWNNYGMRGLCHLVVIFAIGIHTLLTTASKLLGLFPWIVHQSYALQQVQLT